MSGFPLTKKMKKENEKIEIGKAIDPTIITAAVCDICGVNYDSEILADFIFDILDSFPQNQEGSFTIKSIEINNGKLIMEFK
jgi:hypothetical protein